MSTKGALEGLTVLDLSRILAGPFCTQVLSDLGAIVWKVEPPWGDDVRRFGPPFTQGESAFYLSTNRGKKSLAINLKDPRGQELVRALVGRADVLVENFKPGDLARYGLDYESMARANPRIIYASITGFGHSGPRRDEPGYDIVAQALSGIMSVTGEPDGPPMRVGVAWIDLLSGLTAAVGVLAALHERERSARGQEIDLSLFDVGLMSMVNLAQDYLVTGTPPRRLGNAHPQVAPYQAFEALDGWFTLAVGNDDQYQRMSRAIGHAGLWEDERFRTNAGRVKYREELASKLTDIFRRRGRGEWLDAMERARVPAAPVYGLADGLQDPQAEARRTVWEVPHPALGKLRLMANALQHMGRTPASPQGHPPMLGEHTREVLTEVLGLGQQEVDSLDSSGVVVCGPRDAS